MFKIAIIEHGRDAITRSLALLSAKAQDFTPLMRSIAGTLADEAEENFAALGRPDKWVPLAPATLKAKGGRRKNGMILQDTGRLAASITTAYGSDYAQVGTNVVYARIHQLGGKAGRNHAVTIPARPYLYVSPGGWDEIGDAVTRFIRGANINT